MDVHKREMRGVRRCKHCWHRPVWRDNTKQSKSPFEGWLEHYCGKGDFYLHGRWQEVLNEWAKQNLD